MRYTKLTICRAIWSSRAKSRPASSCRKYRRFSIGRHRRRAGVRAADPAAYARGVPTPTTEIDEIRGATRRVLRSIEDLTDEQAAAPSRLPGWTRAEVVTHL